MSEELARKLMLQIVTPQRLLAEEQVDEVQLPGRRGYLGILPGHAPLLTELGVGDLKYRLGKDVYHLAIANGFAEVLPDRLIVLAEIGERAEEIDPGRARDALKRAEERLAMHSESGIDWERALAALERARVRSEVAVHGGASADLE
ncbi:MAG: F0F1 ATP synthase subunit epsilon [Candidatus Acidiferrales bacterium]